MAATSPPDERRTVAADGQILPIDRQTCQTGWIRPSASEAFSDGQEKKKHTITGSMKLAAKHLLRVEDAREAPDWDNLAIYGLYCLEASVRAAVLKIHGDADTTLHSRKAEQAKELSTSHGLPKIAELMQLLNEARKSEAYDDEDFDESDHDADDVADQIKAYVDAVKRFVSS